MSTARVILGKYPSVEALYGAARSLQAAGHSALDFYSPYPLPGSDEVLRLKRSPVPLVAGTAAAVGVASGVLMQWWMNDVDYAINVANRSVVPSVAVAEVKELNHEMQHEAAHAGEHA